MTQAIRDPRTYQPLLEREGLPGHHGLSRDEVLFLRVPHHIKQRIEFVAWKEGRSINDVACDLLVNGLLGPLPGVAAVEPPAPELTPEVALEHSYGLIKETYEKADLAKAKEQAQTKTIVRHDLPEPKGEDLWTPLRAALTEQVGEDFFEIWLSSVFFQESNDERLVLRVPNTHFKEYLGDRVEVIQEQILRKFNKHLQVELVVPGEVTYETITQEVKPENTLLKILTEKNISTVEELEAFEISTMADIYRSRLDWAQRRATPAYHDRHGNRKPGETNQKQLAEEVAILHDQRIAEEKAHEIFRQKRRVLFKACNIIEKLRENGNPRYHRQYAPRSHFNPEAPITRKDLKDFS